MGTAFWVRRALTVFSWTAVLLFGVSLLKGQDVAEAAGFSALWAAVSTAVFVGARIVQSRRGQACALCQDTPMEAGEAAPRGA